MQLIEGQMWEIEFAVCFEWPIIIEYFREPNNNVESDSYLIFLIPFITVSKCHPAPMELWVRPSVPYHSCPFHLPVSCPPVPDWQRSVSAAHRGAVTGKQRQLPERCVWTRFLSSVRFCQFCVCFHDRAGLTKSFYLSTRMGILGTLCYQFAFPGCPGTGAPASTFHPSNIPLPDGWHGSGHIMWRCPPAPPAPCKKQNTKLSIISRKYVIIQVLLQLYIICDLRPSSVSTLNIRTLFSRVWACWEDFTFCLPLRAFWDLNNILR